MIGLFSSIGEHVPIFKKEKRHEASCEGWANRLHYRATSLLIMTLTLMVTCPEWISGTGSLIDCMHGMSLPDKVINDYCYISGTFIVPKHHRKFKSEIGNTLSDSGVGPYDPTEDEIKVKAYYQWVPFVLFMQGIMFYLPHILFKEAEGGKVKNILGSLNLFVLSKEDRLGAIDTLADYFCDTMGVHDLWSLGLLGAHATYLLNVIGQVFFTDMFLGYEFSTYGVNAASFLEAETENRFDPMVRIFPRVTKCTFHKYGPSGGIQRHDAQCILPINILNEKIYVFLWFWFATLTCITIIDVCHHIGLINFQNVRQMILFRKLKTAPKFKTDQMNIDVDFVSRNCSFGDWKLLYHLIRNMDSCTSAEFLNSLSRKMKKRQKDLDADRVPLIDAMKTAMSTQL